MTIDLGHALVAEIDDEDWPLVHNYSWHGKKRRNGLCYAATSVRAGGAPKTIYLHRLLLGFPKGLIDHEDGNPLNNKRLNLRIATNGQNGANTLNWTGAKTSKYKGVSFRRDLGKWEARIGSRPKLYLGCFESEDQAAKAYDAEKIKLYGVFAKTNFSVIQSSKNVPAGFQ